MTKIELIEEAKKQINGAYNPVVLADTIESGIPENAVIFSMNGLTVIKSGEKAIGKDLAGNVVKEMDLTGDFADKAIIMYAINQAHVSAPMGSL